MPQYELDFTNVESYALLGAGTHSVIVSKAEYKTASTGTPMLSVTYKNSNGDAAFDNFTLVPQSLWKLKMFLEAVFGVPITGKINLDPATLLNRPLVIKIQDEPYIDDMGKAGSRARVLPEYTVAQISAVVNTPINPNSPSNLFNNPGMPQPPVQNISSPTPTPIPTPTPVVPQPNPVVTPVIPTTPSIPQAGSAEPARPKLPWER